MVFYDIRKRKTVQNNGNKNHHFKRRREYGRENHMDSNLSIAYHKYRITL